MAAARIRSPPSDIEAGARPGNRTRHPPQGGRGGSCPGRSPHPVAQPAGEPLTMMRIVLHLLSAIPTLLGVIIATFLLTRVLPGDPAVFFASNPSMSETDIAALRESMGLDKSLPEQFLIYLKALMQGDLGNSLTTGQSVVKE